MDLDKDCLGHTAPRGSGPENMFGDLEKRLERIDLQSGIKL